MSIFDNSDDLKTYRVTQKSEERPFTYKPYNLGLNITDFRFAYMSDKSLEEEIKRTEEEVELHEKLKALKAEQKRRQDRTTQSKDGVSGFLALLGAIIVLFFLLPLI